MLMLGAIAGAFSGAVLLILSHLAPLIGAGSVIRDTDKPRVFGAIITRRESHMIGILVHLLFSIVAGGAYAFCVQVGVFSGFGFLSLLGWSVVMWLFVGGIILPLEGHGIFGVQEDAWFPVDLVLTNIAWAIIYWGIIGLWPFATSS